MEQKTENGMGKSYDVPRTQKAKSVFALANNSFLTPKFEIFSVSQFANGGVPEKSGTQGILFANPPQQLVGKFVRPCPMRPRHGFVDSRPINSLEEAEAIVKETANQESDAELITMPFVNSEYSGIWTEGLLAIGAGTDGATTGKQSRSIPIQGFPCSSRIRWEKAKKEAGITESPYVELLFEKNSYDWKTLFVQLRNGPSIPYSIDYVPEKITVKNVVLAEGDLLAWETAVKSFPPGTVVHHPSGNLSSHYAVHAILNRIPVIVSHAPVVGETIEATGNKTATPDIKAIKAGFLLGTQAKLSQRMAGYCMLVACHSIAVWLGSHDLLLGFGMGCAYRLTLTAGLGEMRHKPERKRKPSRNAVYQKVWDKVLTAGTRTRYLAMLKSFRNDNWPRSFGGYTWYVFTNYAGEIYNHILDENVKASLETLNKLVNAAHNGGWAFDKFLSKEIMDRTAGNPCSTLLSVAPDFYSAIFAGEEEFPKLVSWWKGKKHFQIEASDTVEARKDEQEEIDEEEEGNEESEDWECVNCGFTAHCPDCASEQGHNCHKGENSPVISAQCKLNKEGTHLHIQYKKEEMPNGKKYYTKDVPADDYIKSLLLKCKLYSCPLQSSYAGGESMYTLMFKGCNTGFWYIGSGPYTNQGNGGWKVELL